MTIVTLPVPKDEVVDIIKKIAKADDGRLALSEHCIQRMLERDILQRQVINCIRQGNPVRGPDWDTNIESGWKVTFERVCAGQAINVGVKLLERETDFVLVLTTFDRS